MLMYFVCTLHQKTSKMMYLLASYLFYPELYVLIYIKEIKDTHDCSVCLIINCFTSNKDCTHGYDTGRIDRKARSLHGICPWPYLEQGTL